MHKMNTLRIYLKCKASTITKFVSNLPLDSNESRLHLPASSNSPEQEKPFESTLFDVYDSMTHIQGSQGEFV